MRAILVLAIVLLCAVGRAEAADADGLDLTLHAGPVAWQEEHWDVKADKLAAFLAVYEAEYFALARRIPGYRGDTIFTSIPGPEENGPPRPTARNGVNTRLGADPHFIAQHPGIWFEGRVLTERSVNVGLAMQQTYNVVIVHHHQSWTDAERFSSAMDLLYASEHHGANFADHLAQTLYPLANNVWSATYRLIGTGLAIPKAPASAMPTAYPAPGIIVEEHWDVAPGDMQAFLDAYDREVYATLRQVQGYRGYSIYTSLPPGPNEPAVPLALGPSAEMYVNRPGMLLDGTVRTDRAFNAGAMFRNTFNLKILHYVQSWEDMDEFRSRFLKIYSDSHDGVSPLGRDGWTETVMPLGGNHWDMYYRVLEMSFMHGTASAHPAATKP